jgi:hypothetical protein
VEPLDPARRIVLSQTISEFVFSPPPRAQVPLLARGAQLPHGERRLCPQVVIHCLCFLHVPQKNDRLVCAHGVLLDRRTV